MKKILKTSNLFLRFILKITTYLTIIFAIHVSILAFFKKPLFENQLLLAYLINLVLAIVIFKALLFFRKKSNDYLGYVFMYGSFFKFLLFFLFLYPKYNIKPGNSKEEFITFFVPYLICLIIEIKSLINLLNPSQKQD